MSRLPKKNWQMKKCGIQHAHCKICRPDIHYVVRVGSLNGMFNKKQSASARVKMSLARKGKAKTLDHRQKISAGLSGLSKSTAHKNALSLSLKRHGALPLPDCKCSIHERPVYVGPTKLAWTAYDILLKDFSVVIPEERFGAYNVDFLLAEEWLGIEVDGDGWHKNTQEKDARRDALILETFQLPIVRITQTEIREMEKSLT